MTSKSNKARANGAADKAGAALESHAAAVKADADMAKAIEAEANAKAAQEAAAARVAFARAFCAYADQTEASARDQMAAAVKAGFIVAAYTTADGVAMPAKLTDNEELVDEFKSAAIEYWTGLAARTVHVKLVDETTGKVELCEADDAKALHVTVAYSVALSNGQLGVLKGTRNDMSTLKGWVCKLRDDANTYASNRWKKLGGLIERARGTKAATRDLAQYLDDTGAALVKKLGKEGYNKVTVRSLWAQFVKGLEAAK